MRTASPSGAIRMVSTSRREEFAELPGSRRAFRTPPAGDDAHQSLQQIRGLLKTFGVVLAPGKGTAVLAGCPTDPLVRAAMAALLAAWWRASAEGAGAPAGPPGPR